VKRRCVRRVVAVALSAGMLLQAGSCAFPASASATLIAANQLLATLIREALIAPVNQALTGFSQNLFDND